jgi:hypothetical protein
MKVIGRPPTFNEAMKREVVRLVSQGFSVRLAARSVGCAEGTVRYARKNDPEFAQQFEQVGAERELALLRIIRQAAKDPRQWRAGAWLLERMFPERYAPCKGRGRATCADRGFAARFAADPPTLRKKSPVQPARRGWVAMSERGKLAAGRRPAVRRHCSARPPELRKNATCSINSL